MGVRLTRAGMVIVLMGVAGSGKTTVGERLARALGWPFRDADEFHTAAAVAKMAAGTPLTDEDRAPWLAAIRAFIAHCVARGENAVVTCSALRERYRRTILTDPAHIRLVHLTGNPELIRERVQHRHGHFLKADLVPSQFATLEPPAPGTALTVDVSDSPDAIVARIRHALSV